MRLTAGNFFYRKHLVVLYAVTSAAWTRHDVAPATRFSGLRRCTISVHGISYMISCCDQSSSSAGTPAGRSSFESAETDWSLCALKVFSTASLMMLCWVPAPLGAFGLPLVPIWAPAPLGPFGLPLVPIGPSPPG